MEYPPSDWDVFAAEDFEIAVPRVTGDYTAELLAQARPNGRVMDHWRITLDGAKMLETEIEAALIIRMATNLPGLVFKLQQWPKDIQIRRNMTTSAWTDIKTMLAANEVTVRGEGEDNLLNSDVLETLNNLGDQTINSASLRWAVCIGESGKLEIQLQCLPAPATILGGKPIFKRYPYYTY